ncbi:DUF2231 domain-containing protein [Krasilnikovia sp. MM14-A1259]|uniref:DUF2231 domain-containing protein n=1 Tax=Krasilnikovia sp. MM14-A1259 TaxID=3373539 RepID=UPI003816D8B6
MESRLRIAGEAVHPVLVMFPLGLFTLAVIFDVADVLGAPHFLGALAYWNIVAGLAAGALATVAGAIDMAYVPHGTPAKRAGMLQILTSMGVLILFAVILILRMRTPDRVAGGGLLVVELLALGAGGVAIWYGGTLVKRHSPPAPIAHAQAGIRIF